MRIWIGMDIGENMNLVTDISSNLDAHTNINIDNSVKCTSYRCIYIYYGCRDVWEHAYRSRHRNIC